MAERRKVPDLLLEQFVLDELDGETGASVTRRLEEEKDGKERLASLERSNREILAACPPGPAVAEIHRRHDRFSKTRRRHRVLWLGGPAAAAAAAAAAAVVLLVVVPVMRQKLAPRDVPPPGRGKPALDTRPKGEPFITVYRKGERGAEELRTEDTVRAGDLLQVAYTANKEKHGVILSMDGRGVVTLHFPRTETASTRLEGGKPRFLPYAYELDDAPRFERFFFVTSDRPIPVGTVLEAARALKGNPKGVPKLPSGATLRSDLTFKKQVKRRAADTRRAR